MRKFGFSNQWDTDHPELIEFEGETLGDTLTNLLAEVKRLRAWKKLVSDIVQQHDGSHLREMLKEMIE